MVNLILLLTPDTLVFKYFHAVDNKTWGNNLEWKDFQGQEPDGIGEMDARIVDHIYWKFNRVYNFPRFISVTVLDEANSWVRPGHDKYEGNLLHHEQIHFDITEWTRREFQDSIYNLVRPTPELVYNVYNHYKTVNSIRQKEYDSISDHGIDYIGQIKWNRKVKLKLEQ